MYDLLPVPLSLYPSLLAVGILPRKKFVSTPGGGANFQCVSLNGAPLTNVSWLVNGTELELLNLTNVTARGRWQLLFAAIPEAYNATSVQCRGLVGGVLALSRYTPMLYLQGMAPLLH